MVQKKIGNHSKNINKQKSKIKLCYVNTIMVAFISYEIKDTNSYIVNRLVVHPKFQGLGFGKNLLEFVGNYLGEMGKNLYIKTEHPALLNYLKTNELWIDNGMYFVCKNFDILNYGVLRDKGKITKDNKQYIYNYNKEPIQFFTTYNDAKKYQITRSIK